MAGRPEKHTVDYFPHDAGASSGRTLTILFNHFGHEGLSAWWQLLEVISSTNNHIVYIKNTDSFEYLAARIHFTPDRLRQILDKMAGLEAIDSEWYAKGFIWCPNFVDRIKYVYDSRHQELPDIDVIVDHHEPIVLPNNSISLPNNSISGNGENPPYNPPYIELNKSKGNKRKEKQISLQNFKVLKYRERKKQLGRELTGEESHELDVEIEREYEVINAN